MDKNTSEVELHDGLKLIMHFDGNYAERITCNGQPITTVEARRLIDQSIEAINEMQQGES